MTTQHEVSIAHLPLPAPGLRLAMTYDEYLAWAPETMLAEWTEGEVSVAMPPLWEHQRLIGLLHGLLSWLVDAQDLGIVALAPFEVRLLPGRSSREPDLLFVARERLHLLGQRRFEGGPDLVMEIVSNDSVTRDYHDKRLEYQEAGVREYWIVDPRPRQRTITLHRLDRNNLYHASNPISGDEEARSEVVPGFALRPSWLWEEPTPHLATLLKRIAAPGLGEEPL